MSADLSSRLKRIKEARRQGRANVSPSADDPARTGEPRPAGAGANRDQPADAAPEREAGSKANRDQPAYGQAAPAAGLDGWREVAPLVLARETSEPLDAAAAARFQSALLGREISLGELAFMDTETTGLSGGAGTTVFLVGSGRVRDGELRVRQLLLADFPGEPAFLHEVARALEAGVWVSYNGKAFDVRLLESRFLMNGMPPLDAEQIDLLTWSRRLFRARIGSCSLGDVERRVLGRGRADDIPGIEIPERYFHFLRSRDGAVLGDVFEHHRLDIVSLVHLFLRIERILRTPLDEAEVDWYRLGRWMLPRDAPLACRLLERAASEEGEDALRATLVLSRVLRRQGRSDEALALLNRTGHELDEPFARALAVERAKLFEHDLRDAHAARTEVERYLEAGGEMTREMAHRLARLTRKTG